MVLGLLCRLPVAVRLLVGTAQGMIKCLGAPGGVCVTQLSISPGLNCGILYPVGILPLKSLCFAHFSGSVVLSICRVCLGAPGSSSPGCALHPSGWTLWSSWAVLFHPIPIQQCRCILAICLLFGCLSPPLLLQLDIFNN